MPEDCITNHHAFVYDRGGVQRLWDLNNIGRSIWGRVRDDHSESEADIAAAYCDAQADVLNAIEPGRHELVIYRGDERVHEGPITRLEYNRSGVNIFARDISHYLQFLIMQAAYSNAFPNVGRVTDRMMGILTAELTRKNLAEAALGLPSVNILPYIVNHSFDGDARTAASTYAAQYTVFEHLDTMAANNGIDYTVVGRALHMWDTHQRAMGQTPEVTEADFIGEAKVTVYGQELGTRSVVTDGQGNYGAFGDTDPYYGLWERLATAYDEDEDEGPPPSKEAMTSQAQRNMSGRNPTPLQVRVPDNSSVNPKGVLSISDLVPGVWIPLRATLVTRRIKQMQKLDSMRVTEEPTGEKVEITMYPAAGADQEEPA